MTKEMINLKEEVYNHVAQQSTPITASEVALAVGISTQKASALLNSLCYEGLIKWEPYRTTKGYGTEDIFPYHNVKIVGDNNTINIEVTTKNNDNTVEFTVEKESYKNKFLSLLYNIIYDYFYEGY